MTDPAAGPPPPPPDLAMLVMLVGRRVRERIEAGLRARSMSLRHLSALGHLHRDPGRSYSELARRAGITPQSMQATLLALETMGAVERRTPAGRGRSAELHVTELGRDLNRWAQSVVTAVNDDLFAAVPPAQRRRLAETLATALTDPTPERDTAMPVPGQA